MIRIFLTFFSLLTLCGCANSLFYHPDNRPYSSPSTPYETVSFKSADGTTLSGWFLPAIGVPSGTIIHYHGNAANISNHYGFVKWIPKAGFNLFMFDYRGYGDSKGSPSRNGLHQDAVAALRYLASRKDVDKKKIVALGQSLGGATAVDAVLSVPEVAVCGVVIDSAFYSYRTIVKDKIALIPLLGWAQSPLSFIMATDGYSPGPRIDQIAPIPLLIIHGTHDNVVPFAHGKKLFEAARHPKTFWRVEHGVHTSALIQPHPLFRNRLSQLFHRWVKQPPKSSPQA